MQIKCTISEIGMRIEDGIFRIAILDGVIINWHPPLKILDGYIAIQHDTI